MTRIIMNLRDLEYFVKTAELKHFSKAAAALFVSQPTLSQQIKKLEAELSVTLFHREGKKIDLTEAGLNLLPLAKKLVDTAKELKNSAKTLKNPFALPLRLGVIPTIAPYLMPSILSDLHMQLPRLNLSLIEDKTERLLQQLQQNEIDLALLALPIAHSFKEAVLFEEPFVVALPKNHPLAQVKNIHRDALQDETILMLEEGHCLREHALQYCDRFDPAQENYRAASLETLCQMVALGHGITLLPHFAAQNRPFLAIVPFENPVPTRKIGLVFKENSVRRLAIDLLHEQMDILLKKL